jgi:hypothetical protein
MWAGLAQGGLISPFLFSVYVNDMPSPSHRIKLALYADDAATIATFRNATLPISYLQSYLKDHYRWLSEWRIAINISYSIAIILARARKRFIRPDL